jgi:hypothetical protein
MWFVTTLWMSEKGQAQPLPREHLEFRCPHRQPGSTPSTQEPAHD